MPISVKTPPSLARLAPALRAVVMTALGAEKRRPGEIGVVLADDGLLRELNRDYRGLDKATDVLSFGYDETGEGLPKGAPRDPARPIHGDLIVSMDRVREQAKRFGVSEAEELARLVVHGSLHLAGLDHQKESERAHMRAREEAALAASAPAVAQLSATLAAVAIPGSVHRSPQAVPPPSAASRSKRERPARTRRRAT